MLALTKLKDHICCLIRNNTTTLHSDELICYMYALIVAAGVGRDINNPRIPISIIKCEHYVDSYITHLGTTMRDAPLPHFIMLRHSQQDLLNKLPAKITTVHNAVQLYYNAHLEAQFIPTPELKYAATLAHQHAQECCNTIDIDMSTSNGNPQHLGERISNVYTEQQAKLHRFEYVVAKEHAQYQKNRDIADAFDQYTTTSIAQLLTHVARVPEIVVLRRKISDSKSTTYDAIRKNCEYNELKKNTHDLISEYWDTYTFLHDAFRSIFTDKFTEYYHFNCICDSLQKNVNDEIL